MAGLNLNQVGEMIESARAPLRLAGAGTRAEIRIETTTEKSVE